MKGFPPSLKRKKRYIAFELISEDRINGREFMNEVTKTMLAVFGELNSAHSDIWLEYFNGRHGILRCNREALDKIKFVLNLINRVGNTKIVTRILGVSGTIRRCKKKYLEVLRNASSSNGIRPGNNSI